MWLGAAPRPPGAADNTLPLLWEGRARARVSTDKPHGEFRAVTVPSIYPLNSSIPPPANAVRKLAPGPEQGHCNEDFFISALNLQLG